MVMDATNALAVIRALETQSVEVWLRDGGWGVDALLGEQTRPHKDVDLIVRVDQTENAVQALRGLDFVVAEGRLSSCFVLRDQEGRSVDVHPVVFDEEGNGDYTMENGEVWVYEASLQPRRGLLRRRPAQAR
jgi:lincosamide nucleotidyltransferase A/C/D/E